VLGPVGAILAIPLRLLVKVLLVDVDPHTRWMAHLVTGNAPDDPPDDVPPAAVGPPGGPSVTEASTDPPPSGRSPGAMTG
jgi:AI-2 transport protein TqsA